MPIAESDVIAAVAGVLGVSPVTIDPDEDLLRRGIDSISAMELAAQWRRAGASAGFVDLLERPRLRDWVELVADVAPDRADEFIDGRERREPETASESDTFDLATMAHAYWAGRQPGQRLGGVAAHFYNEFDGRDVDPVQLETAVRALFERHDMLRAAFDAQGRQRVLARSPWPGLRVHDFRTDPEGLDRLRSQLSHRQLGVARGEVFDVQLSRTPQGTRVHVNLDMLAADAQSLRVLFADLAALYRDPRARLPELRYSYRRYLIDRDRLRDRPEYRTARAYWADRLPELPGAPAIPESRTSPGTQVVRKHYWLPPDARHTLEQRARGRGLTPAMAVASVFAEVIGNWSAQTEFLLNVPLFDRDPLHPVVGDLVGDFTSSVLVAVDSAEAGTFTERATALQTRFRRDAAHASYPGVDVLRDLGRHHAEPQLAPVVYTSALGLGELFATAVRESFGDPVWIISQGPQVALDAQVTEFDGGLLVNWDAREQIFAPGVLDAMFTAYTRLLDSLVADEAAWDGPLPDLLPQVQRTVRESVNATDKPRAVRTLHDRFFALADAQPDAPAVLWGDDGCLTYGELAGRARAVAADLPAGQLIPVRRPKGPDQIVDVLGILAAGSAYLPVGADQPQYRRERILAAAGSLPEAADLAYVIYTSGSTGEPKGVQITHSAAANTIDDLIERFHLSSHDRALAISALDFDLSVFDIFAPLSVGGAIVLIGEDERRDPAAWAQLAVTHEVTVLNCVPAILDMLLTGCPPLPLRVVLIGGDRVGADLPGRLHRVAPDCVFAALGGTTETAIHSTIQLVDEVDRWWTSIPYGTPLSNVRCRVVDALGRDRPDWVPGELWIGGAGVASGYLGDPQRTRQKFTDGWYRTGDLARYLPDGTLEFLGRADHQIKIRGHRIEPGEIDAALSAHPTVGAAVTVAAGNRLAAAVTPVIPKVEATTYDPDCLPPEDQIPVVRATLARLLMEKPCIRERFGPLVQRWERWLAETDGFDTAASPLPCDTLLAVLSGDRDPLVLLDDPVLAPRSLLWSLPESSAALADLTTVARHLVLSQGSVHVAELGDHTGDRLVAALCSDADLSREALRHSRIALGGEITADLHGRCDLVVCFATLHTYRDPAAGVAAAAYLLRPGGRLFLVEQPSLPPLGLLTAAVLENGFPHGDPMLSPQRWQQLLAAGGFAVERTLAHGSLFSVSARWTGVPVDVADLSRSLADFLPEYMRPDRIRVLPRMPLSANGKVDRRALTELLADRGPAPAVTAPRTDAQRHVASVWSHVLGVHDIGCEHDFFALGGDSLLATRMIAHFPGARLADLYAHRTLAAFAAQLSDSDAGPAQTITADPDRRHDPFPASEIQRAYWIGRGAGAALGGVGTHYYSEFHCPGIDIDRFEQAWHHLIARHDMLRAVFDEDGNQRVLRAEELPQWRVRRTDRDVREVMSHQVLDTSSWPLFDVRLGPGNRIGISLDNILLDGLSMMILFSELDLLYHDPDAALPQIDVTFRDYLTQVRPEREDEARQYWRERIPELPPAPSPPLRLDPASVGTPRFMRRSGLLPAARWQRLREVAREYGITPTVLLLACYGEVLAVWSGRPDVTVNVTLFDRRAVHPHINRVLGDFTSLLFTEFRSGATIIDAARELHRRMWADLDHRDAGPMWILRELARHHGEQVGFPAVFTSALGVAEDGLTLDPSAFGAKVFAISQTPQVWLDLQVHESDAGLEYALDAVEELFQPGVVSAMFTAFEDLVGAVADGSARTLPEITSPQRGVGAAGARSGLLHSGFFDQPSGAVAVIHDGREITYGELAHRALSIAATLPAGEVIAVSLPKGPDQIAAVLGVLAAGSAYLPIGVDQPQSRRERILAAAEVSTVIDDLDRHLSPTPLSAPVPVRPDSLAYVIYTSGSTGAPKGVEITHAAAYNTVTDINERYDVDSTDRVLAVSALDFDLSVYDIFGMLSAGAAIVLVDEDQRRDAPAWVCLVGEHGVTVWNTVPTLLDMLLTAHADETATLPLRVVMVSGDWVGLDLPDRLHTAAPGCRFLALGGATEAAIWSNVCEVEQVPPQWTSIPYGLALRGQRYRVVDENGRDCPDWVPGELWIGGAGVARGYRGDPGLTAEKFVISEGQRWYRTGDRGRFWGDGTLEFLGRTDHQVKIRGHRIELGEIESALAACPGVADSVAVATGPRAQRRLIGFVVPADAGTALDIEALREHLRGQLPTYAVPHALVPMAALPLTANGKVDRRALADIEPAPTAAPPEGPTERLLAELLGELLDVSVGRDDNFFALGCDSLVVTRLTERLRREHSIRLTLREVFGAPTIADLAGSIDNQQFEEGEL
ncbi:amino acid adenylation domain-containing protein [Nocardia sp. NPDC050710]|uniref:non-ribosomal peptide synthetase n=1 Tax=Nocardia sp. NPDC050710 TaxID=3157220 RepID=UPI0033DEBD7D